jgi:hypothetical protein
MAKPKANLTVVPPSTLAKINADIEALNVATSKLREADRELAKEAGALRDASSPIRDADLHQAAVALLDGQPAAPAQTTAQRIREVAGKRQAIAKALEIADERMTRLLYERAVERRKEAAEPWVELQRERALAVARLRELNRRAYAMLAPLLDPRGLVDMPAAFAGKPAGTFLIGSGSVAGTDADMFLKACISVGIITQEEIEKDRN